MTDSLTEQIASNQQLIEQLSQINTQLTRVLETYSIQTAATDTTRCAAPADQNPHARQSTSICHHHARTNLKPKAQHSSNARWLRIASIHFSLIH